MKILIVDDQFVSRIKAQRILSQFGKCDITGNGKEALEAFELSYLENELYDLIIMDIIMPDMDGVEALEKIRKFEASKGIIFGKGVKVLMVSAAEDPKIFMKAFQKGCEGYIIKPFTREKLIDAIKKFYDLQDIFKFSNQK